MLPSSVLVTATIQFLLWRDKKKAAELETVSVPTSPVESTLQEDVEKSTHVFDAKTALS